jgi:hypothetical protein
LALNAFCVLLFLAICLFVALRALSGSVAFWALAASALCLCDARIVAYVNSFYQESGAYVGLFLLVCALPVFWERPGMLQLLAVGGAAAAVGLAKIAYAPAILPAIVPVAAGAVRRRPVDPAIRTRAVAAAAVLAGLLAAFLIFPKDLFVPENTYQFVFSGAIPHLPEEQRGSFLSAVGFDAGDASLSGMNAYSQGNRIHDPNLRHLLTRRTQLRAALELLLRHPTAFLRMFRDGFSTAGIYPAYNRPSFGNRHEPEPREWAAWSSIRASLLSGIPSYVAAFALWMGLLAIAQRARAQDTMLFFLLASGGFLAASILAVSVSIIGNGPADIYKHNYLANLLLDAALVWIVTGAAAGLLSTRGTSRRDEPGNPVC